MKFTYWTMPEFLSKAECERLISSHHPDDLQPSLVGADGDYNSELRSSHIKWIEDDEIEIADRLLRRIHRINADAFGFDLHNYVKELQLTRYGPQDFYDWHTDNVVGDFPSCRKLSAVVNLSNQSSYTGGGFELYGHVLPPEASQMGTLIVFPSFYLHRAKKVESGVRYSLVTWIYGHNFR